MKSGFGSFEEVAARSKEYEQVVVNRDPLIEDIKTVIALVKDVIRKNKYIVYGGTAIDFALRIKGSKLYPDESLAIADLDFFAPDSVTAAYDLADTLKQMGYSSRAIVASYVRTMRVDLGDNHFIADISYIPREALSVVPTIEFDGMLCVHPDYQKLDLHSSLSYPYDNAPREVIFDRWNKDIKRYNMLETAYPVVVPDTEQAPLFVVKLTNIHNLGVYSGWAAYCILATVYRKLGYDDIPRADFSISEGRIKFEAPDAVCEIAHFNTASVLEKLDITGCKVTHYNQFVNIFPARTDVVYSDWTLRISSTRGRLLSTNSADFGAVKVRYANIQYIMRFMLANAMVSTGGMRALYLQHYKYLQRMISTVESKYEGTTAHHINVLRQSPFFPSINTFGAENVSLSSEASLQRLNHTLGRGDPPLLPDGYTPGSEKGRGAPFDYKKSIYFAEDGQPTDLPHS